MESAVPYKLTPKIESIYNGIAGTFFENSDIGPQ